jgi:hypothetical protein
LDGERQGQGQTGNGDGERQRQQPFEPAAGAAGDAQLRIADCELRIERQGDCRLNGNGDK